MASLQQRNQAAAGSSASGSAGGGSLALALAAALQRVGGPAGFDATTHTKTVAGLLASLDAAGEARPGLI
jgi:hypothetical protein